MDNRNMRALAGAAAMVFTTGLFCQSGEKLPEFEVASIKPAPPPTGNNLRVMMGGDPGRVNMSNITVKDMLRQAYQVKEYQISGPDWMNSTRFDVVATIPAGVARDQLPLMWQSLLADRFKLTLHREKKELPVYALAVGKNGPKLKEAEDKGDSGPKGPGPMPGMGMNRGRIMMGRGRVDLKSFTVAGFAEMLSRQMDRPVIDETKLQGLYDFTLEWTPDERQRLAFLPGGGGPPPGAEDHPRPAGPDGARPNGPDIFAAVQEQLGLKMEAKKAPVEILVIDHVEKTPTEN
jgi:uncharacterized protein (TIGR03435 family)